MQTSAARRVAMDLLARREHSRLELQRKLSLRDFPLPLIVTVLDQLESDNLLSDERFIEAYVRMRSRRGFGPLRIHQELLERGITQELAANAISVAQIDWCQLLRAVHMKKHGIQADTHYAAQVKQRQFLSYRGFSHDQINNVLGDKHEI